MFMIHGFRLISWLHLRPKLKISFSPPIRFFHISKTKIIWLKHTRQQYRVQLHVNRHIRWPRDSLICVTSNRTKLWVLERPIVITGIMGNWWNTSPFIFLLCLYGWDYLFHVMFIVHSFYLGFWRIEYTWLMTSTLGYLPLIIPVKSELYFFIRVYHYF